MFEQDYFAFNPLSEDPNKRGTFPILQQLVEVDPPALVAGKITVDVKSRFGKDKGEVFGAYALNTKVADNEVLSVSAAPHATNTGEITITLESSDASSTEDIPPFKLILVGKVLPIDA
jgi:hypothetical protein